MSIQPSVHKVSSPVRSWPTVLIYFVLLVLVGLRPLIQETHSTQRILSMSTLGAVPETSPLPTLWFGFLVLMMCILICVLRDLNQVDPLPRTGMGVGSTLVIVASIASCFVASNHRLAINATLDWVTLLLLLYLLIYVTRTHWQIKLLLCVVLASGASNAVECFDQVYASLPDTQEYYQERKEAFWEDQGVPLDSYRVELFERRLRERAATASFSLANIAGSYFVLIVFAALGLAHAVRNRFVGGNHKSGAISTQREDSSNASFLLFWLIAAGATCAMLLTRSRGAMIALALGIAGTFAIFVLRRWLQLRPRTIYWSGWGVVLLVLGSVAAYGLKYDSLPGGSLTYRWWYVQSAARLVSDHPLLGVGTEQFGRYYPRYKEIKSPEEIQNPHNFLARAASEWGAAGLLGMLMMLGGGSWWLACGCSRRSGTPVESDSLNIAAGAYWMCALGITIFALRVWISGHTNILYLYANNLLPFMVWNLVFFLSMCVKVQDMARTAVWLGMGVLAFLVHNLITFSLDVPGSAVTFFALLAALFAIRSFQEGDTGGSSVSDGRLKSDWFKPASRVLGGFLLLVSTYVFLIRPVHQSWTQLGRARASEGLSFEDMRASFLRAAVSDPLDPTPLLELLESIPKHYSLEESLPARGQLDDWRRSAIARDPENLEVFRALGGVYLLYYRVTQERDYLHEGQAMMSEVLMRYPTSPEDHLRMSEIQLELFESTGDPSALEASIEELEAALELNAARDFKEVRRFDEGRLNALQGHLEQLRVTSSKLRSGD